MKRAKQNYVFIVQVNHGDGYGWQDIIIRESHKEAKDAFKALPDRDTAESSVRIIRMAYKAPAETGKE